MTKKDKVFFNTAKNISELSDHHFKIGCVVVDKHRIISSGHNSSTKTHPLQARLDKKEFGLESRGAVHAELSALLPLLYEDLSTSTVYIYRENKSGEYAMARPCSRCMKLLKSLGVKRIKYTTDAGIAEERI